MAREGLTLVTGGGPGTATSRTGPILVGTLVFAVVLCTAWLGAGFERGREGPREQGQRLIDRALAEGLDDAGVVAELRRFRVSVGRRPLDSMERIVYAGLLTTFSRTVEDLEVPAFHAQRAAQLAPVTVPVVRRAAIVLHATGHLDESTGIVRDMFTYDPEAAAELLASLRSSIGQSITDGSVPDRAEAWLAWSRRLRADDDDDESDRALQHAVDRWPANLDVVREATLRAAWRNDWTTILTLSDPEVNPDVNTDAKILAARSRALVETGDVERAEQDATRALEISNDSVSVLVYVGDTRYALGQTSRARELWSRALWRTPDGSGNMKVALQARLARLEDEHGRPDAALRAWKAVLALDPDHRKARDRIYALTGTIPAPAPAR